MAKEHMTKGKYAEYLQSKRWKYISYCMHKWANGFCTLCNKPSNDLHVHHLSYDNLGLEEYNDLIVVCSDCHKFIHKENPKILKITYTAHNKAREAALLSVNLGSDERTALNKAVNMYEYDFDDRIKTQQDIINQVVEEKKMLDDFAKRNGYDFVVSGV